MTAVDQKSKQEADSKSDNIPSGKFKSGRVWKEKSSKYIFKGLTHLVLI